MSLLAIILLVLGLGFIAWLSARARALSFTRAGNTRPHSLPSYHGWYVALWAVLPALLFLAVWGSVSGGLVMQEVMQSPAAANLPPFDMQRTAIFNEARELAEGTRQAAFNPEATALAPVFESAQNRYGIIGAVVALLLAFAGGAYAFTRLSPSFRARTRVERLVMAVLLVASLIAILASCSRFCSNPCASSRVCLRSNSCSGSTGARRRRSAPIRRARQALSERSRFSGGRYS